MGWVLFADSGTGQVETLPSGAVRVMGRIARTGVQTYAPWPGAKVQDRPIKVYRPAEEVFKDSSLETIKGTAVTLGHPPERRVTPETWKRYAVGQNEGDARKVSDSGEEYILTSLVIQDAEAIKAVKDRKAVEISQGYEVELDWTPGVANDGTAYDAIQTQIVHNHTALLAPGEARAGKGARVLLDSNEEKHTPMDPTKFAAALAKAVAGIDAKLRARVSDSVKASCTPILDSLTEEQIGAIVASVKTSLEKLGEPAPADDPTDEETEEEKKKREEEEAKKKAETKTDATDGAELAKKILSDATESALSVVDAREAVREMLDSEYSFEGKSRKQLYLDALKAKAPKVYEAVKDKSDDHIRGAFDFLKSNRASWVKNDSTPIVPAEHREKYSKRMADAFDKAFPGAK